MLLGFVTFLLIATLAPVIGVYLLLLVARKAFGLVGVYVCGAGLLSLAAVGIAWELIGCKGCEPAKIPGAEHLALLVWPLWLGAIALFSYRAVRNARIAQ